MFRVSKLTDYATVLMTHLARSPETVLSAQELAKSTSLELPTTRKVLKRMAGAGLVESYRGTRGGYRLARAPAQISVFQVIAAMEGPVAMTECGLDEGLCPQEPVCSVRGNWQMINRAVVAALKEVNLLDMTQPLAVTTLSFSGERRVHSVTGQTKETR